MTGIVPRHGRGLLVTVVAALAACAEPKVAPLVVPAQCRAITLIDADTGALVRGAEDLALDPATGVLYVAAVDRWAVETGVQRGAAALAQGALYAIPLAKLVATDRLTVVNAAQGLAADAAFHPQGLDLLRTGGQAWLAVVNRRFRRVGGAQSADWRSEPAVELFAVASAGLVHQRTVSHPRLCRPNDVAFLSATRLAVTNDHGCDGWPDWLEDVLGLARADVVELDLDASGTARGTVLAQGIAFANGITATADGVLYVAATRARALCAYRWSGIDPRGATVLGQIALPGGPDNITQSVDGRLLVAVHPALLELGLYRHRWFGRAHAPSRVVAVTLATGRATVYLDEPDGTSISAATAALVHDGWLIIGSVTDAGLGLCPDPGAPRAIRGPLESSPFDPSASGAHRPDQSSL